MDLNKEPTNGPKKGPRVSPRASPHLLTYCASEERRETTSITTSNSTSTTTSYTISTTTELHLLRLGGQAGGHARESLQCAGPNNGHAAVVDGRQGAQRRRCVRLRGAVSGAAGWGGRVLGR